jgi:hypothetical protein
MESLAPAPGSGPHWRAQPTVPAIHPMSFPKNACFRLLVASLLVMPAAAPAQTAPARPAEQARTRPSTDIDANGAVHAETGFALPSRVAGGFLARAMSYADPPTSNPNLGVSYHYSAPGPILVSVFLYTAGQKPGDGPADPWVQGHFQLVHREMREIARSQNRYENLTMVSPPKECGAPSLRFLCVGYAALVQKQPMYTALLLTGFRGHYLKVRVDWPNDPEAPNAVAELLDDLDNAQRR